MPKGRTDAIADGALASKPLAVLLADACTRGFSGTIALRTVKGETSWVVFAHGYLWKARTATPTAHLGSVAYELGFISADDLNSTLAEIARTKKLHGALLLERGLIQPRQLEQILVAQVRRKVHSLFALPPTTQYAVLDGFDALDDWGGKDWAMCDARASIWHGIREFPPQEHVVKALATLDEGRVQISGRANLGRLGLDAAENSLAECMRARPMSIRELRKTSLVDAQRTDLLFYCLSITQSLEARTLPPQAPPLMANIPAPIPSSARIPVAPPSRPSPPSSRISGTMPKVATPVSLEAAGAEAKKRVEAALVAMQQGKIDRAEALCREVDEIDPHESTHVGLAVWLGIQRSSNPTTEDLQFAVDAMTGLLEKEDDLEHVHFFRGQLLKKLGSNGAAARDFRRVIEINPRRLDAAAELRVYVMRKRKA